LKVAIVAGFFEPVRRALEGRFAKQFEVSSLMWIPQLGNGREPNLGMLESQLARQLAGGAKHILIFVALLGGKQWVEETVNSIVANALSRYEDVALELVFESKAQDSGPIITRLVGFGLPEPSEITPDLLREKLQGQKVLCVVMDGHTGFSESLQRCGFPDECICDEFFEFMGVSRGKNSNLMEVLHGKADTYPHILYAWTGLRTMPAAVKKRYAGKAIEAPTARDACNMFKRWILGD
jgi:hypothetical protein